MAASTSLTLSRSAVPRHGSSTTATQQSTSMASLSIPTFSGLKSTSTSSSRAPTRRQVSSTRRRVIANSAVETLEKTDTALVDKSVNTIRFLAIDAVEKPNSGHPGLPMGCAPMGHILYDEVMKYNPKNPYWFNRDRFVLSAGHGCMLQYALLHLAGYDRVLLRHKMPPKKNTDASILLSSAPQVVTLSRRHSPETVAPNSFTGDLRIPQIRFRRKVSRIRSSADGSGLNPSAPNNNSRGTRLIRALQALQVRLNERIKDLRKDLPMKLLFFLTGFYCSTAFATVIGQTGDWDILSAALAVAVVEGIGALMYTGSFPLFDKARKLVTMFNYWKAGLSMGLFLDSFKY